MTLAQRTIEFFVDFWSEIRRLVVVLWLCRISTASALVALVLAFLPQVQDLYTELTYYEDPTRQDLINTAAFWLTFYALAFAWAFIVHYCARTLLSFESWPLTRDDKENYAFWIEAVPRYLGWICIISIFIGQINALINLQIETEETKLSTLNSYITPLAICLLIIIALQNIAHRYSKIILMVSSVAVLYWLLTAGMIYYESPLAQHYLLQMLHNLTLPVVTILWGCLFYWFVAKRRSLLAWGARVLPSLHHLMLKLTIRVAEFCPILIRPVHNAETRANAPKFFPFQKKGPFQFEAPSENVRGLMLGLFALSGILIIWLLFAIYDPSSPPFSLKRVLLLPVLLGIWVPILSAITFVSNQLRFPFLTAFIGIGLLMSWLISDNHNVELIKPPSSPKIALMASNSQSQKIHLKRAIELWMQHHNCDSLPSSCPPPIIIAAAGGASRSAFYVATVLGEMHDNPALFWSKNLPQNRRPLTAKRVSKQIFAISSVSGGSLASANYAATLRGTDKKLHTPLPCKGDVLRKDKLLFSVPQSALDKSQYPTNWKNCLQAMAAGDFLSPAMIAYAFRDNLAFSSFIGLLTGEDRATALEKAWRLRSQNLTGRPHLNDPLLSYQPTSQNWMPILLFNGTSVTSGKRVIATPLKSTFNRDDKILPLFTDLPTGAINNKRQSDYAIFPDSLDLHDLLKRQSKMSRQWSDSKQSQQSPLDISLVKAVSLSARFPLISPQANLRNQQGDIVDRIVDGGYFDNSGMLTASELSMAIKELTNGELKPILVQISNHPVTLSKHKSATAKTHKFKCPEQSFTSAFTTPDERQLLPELSSVIGALLNARVARGSHAIAKASRVNPAAFIHFQVAAIEDEFGSNKKLSMSWWLSKSVQNALNNQIKWRRDTRIGSKRSIAERLNPAFCAISKFRKSQLNHWQIQ